MIFENYFAQLKQAKFLWHSLRILNYSHHTWGKVDFYSFYYKTSINFNLSTELVLYYYLYIFIYNNYWISMIFENYLSRLRQSRFFNVFIVDFQL